MDFLPRKISVLLVEENGANLCKSGENPSLMARF
jgi:hypothetical protein